MTPKKILIVSQAFFPENSPRSFRATELAKEFARRGHQVTVLTPRGNIAHDLFEQQHAVTIKDMGKYTWKAMSLKGKGIELFVRRAICRFSNLLFEYPGIQIFWLVKRALIKEAGYDLMISIAVPYPVHWGVAAIHSKQRPVAKVWVADCGDPYMGQENDTFNKPFYFNYVEKWFCRKADYITVPTRGSVAAYFKEFQPKIKVISQGFRFEDVAVFKGAVNNGRPLFFYGGMFIPGMRDPFEFLTYLCALTDDYEFRIYTTTPDIVLPFVQSSRGRIKIMPVIPRSELLFEMSKANFVVNFENAGSKQTPSKLIDFIIIEKPILSIKTGALNTTAVDEFLAGNYKQQLTVDEPAQYRIENVCDKFLSLAD